MVNTQNTLQPPAIKITYIGHATFLIELPGLKVITDPILSDRLFFFKRRSPPGLSPLALPEVDYILISHSHLDHLHKPTLRILSKNSTVVCPRYVRRLVTRWGFQTVIEAALWERISLSPAVYLTAVPARHSGWRWLYDFYRGYSGYILEVYGKTIYFAGDTGFFSGFQEIGRRFQVDIALLPIASYSPKFPLGIYHMNPPQAIQAFHDLGARYMIPCHWDAFRLSLEPWGEPLRWLRDLSEQKGLIDKVCILKPGEKKNF